MLRGRVRTLAEGSDSLKLPGGRMVPPRVVAVGSENPAKVQAVRDLCRRAFPGARVVPVPVPSGVPEQPIGVEQTRRGALARAEGALRAAEADWGVGMEGGVEFEGEGGAWVISVVAVVDRAGRVCLACGPRFLLPPEVGRRVRMGQELGPVMDEVTGLAESKRQLGAIGYLTGGLLSRRTAWRVTLAAALPPFFRPDLYDVV